MSYVNVTFIKLMGNGAIGANIQSVLRRVGEENKTEIGMGE